MKFDPASRPLVNQWKRLDVFRCHHETHRRFENRVSVYHVLREKSCYPKGCIYYQWRCRMFNKGKKCPKGFHHVGKKCFSCKEYYDIKVMNVPRFVLPKEKEREFYDELERFEFWAQSKSGKEVGVSATVLAVKPWLTRIDHHHRTTLRFRGFLLVLQNALIDFQRFDDHLYLTVSTNVQNKHRFVPEDEVDFHATFTVDRGRIILKKVNRIEFGIRGDSKSLTSSEVWLSRMTGSTLPYQAEGCMACDQGVLIDVEKGEEGSRRSRELFCLMGEENPALCSYPAFRHLQEEECQKDRDHL